MFGTNADLTTPGDLSHLFKPHLRVCLWRISPDAHDAKRRTKLWVRCAVFWILDLFTRFKNVFVCVCVSRWWKCQPARRHLSERQTSSRLQEEENDRAGVRGSPSEPDLQNAESRRRTFTLTRRLLCVITVLCWRSMTVEQMRLSRCPTAASVRS